MHDGPGHDDDGDSDDGDESDGSDDHAWHGRWVMMATALMVMFRAVNFFFSSTFLCSKYGKPMHKPMHTALTTT